MSVFGLAQFEVSVLYLYFDGYKMRFKKKVKMM